MKLLAQIGKHQVLVLVDLGSVGTFVSENLVQQLRLATHKCAPITYRAADGGLMLSETKVQQLQWFIQGHMFTSEARVLPLRCYDLIVGEDWLEDCNPMWIDYKLKKFSYKGHMVKLQGVQEHTDSCTQISAHKLKGLIKHGAVSHCVQMVVPNIADTQFELSAGPDSDQIVVPEDINQLLL